MRLGSLIKPGKAKMGKKRLIQRIAVGLGIAIGSAVCCNESFAMIGLKQVQVSNGSQVDLLFDGKVGKSQIRTEFFNDIIQLSINDVSVYPAKISSVNGGALTKIFAYQYAPKLVRCRLTVKGKAELYKDRFQLVPNGKILTLRFDEAIVDKLTTRAAQASATVDTKNKPASQKAAPAPDKEAAVEKVKISDSEERKLLEKVLSKTQEKNPEKAQAAAGQANAGQKPLASGKPLPSPFRIFAKFAVVLGFFGLIALGLRKLLRGNSTLSRLTKAGLGKKKMIEVLSTHHLGPKKSIAVVRVAGRTMVIGVTNESINLITQLSTPTETGMNIDITELEDIGLRINEAKEAQSVARESQTAAALALIAAGAVPAPGPNKGFSEFLTSEVQKPGVSTPVNVSNFGTVNRTPNANSAVRAQIRSKLEGLKQL